MGENFRFGGGLTTSVISPVSVAAMVIAVLLIFFLSRRQAIVPLLFMAFLEPYGQQFVVGGLHLFVLRIVILAGLLRMTFSRRSGWDRLDTVFLLWALVRATAFILLFAEIGAFVNQLGFLWDYWGGFLVLRFLIQDDEDVHLAIKTLAVIAMILGACMLNERISQLNVFGYLGGVPLIPGARDGTLRAQGPFAHALLAGTFGATLMPLFVWLWIDGRSRGLALAGLIGSAVIAITSASSTPILAYAAAVFGICLWPLRDRLAVLRWGAVLGTAVLAVVMKAPVWFLIARVDLVGGSSGYHRAMLVDQFIRHFSDWWLIGTNSNSKWGWDMWDTANQFVTEGETGGLLALILFVTIIVICFRKVGYARRACEDDPQREWYIWLLGVDVFSHAVGFFGVEYFDQTRMAWFTLLAFVVAATTPLLQATDAAEAEDPLEATAIGSPDLEAV